MAEYIQLELFESGSLNKESNQITIVNQDIFASNNRFGMSLCENVKFTSTYQMPIVGGYYSEVPRDIICFYRLCNRSVAGVAAHFYTTDSKLLPFLTDPYGHLNKIIHHQMVIGIDISIKPEMLAPMKIALSFANKLIMAWWQHNGLVVVPNVIVDPAIMDICLDGYPKHSVIAMNSSGIGRDERAKHNWQIIYPYVIKTLEPTHILRYGGKQPNEIEEISTYYENDNKKFARYGR